MHWIDCVFWGVGYCHATHIPSDYEEAVSSYEHAVSLWRYAERSGGDDKTGPDIREVDLTQYVQMLPAAIRVLESLS